MIAVDYSELDDDDREFLKRWANTELTPFLQLAIIYIAIIHFVEAK